jgi:NADH-quinone oxidoreductase subunit C
MTPEQLAERAGGVTDGAVATVEFGQVTVDVAPADWAVAAAALRDDPQLDCAFFDWLSAHDAGPDVDDETGLCVVLHVWSLAHRHHVLLRTRVPRDNGRLPSLIGVWAGAAWHERETFEMFGVVFDDHPNLVPLLLPDGFEGHPLRKDFVLASRVAKAWPGAKEPGESDRDTESAAPGRRRMLPPGVPGPGEWGPGARAPEPRS